jgi:hypothetical protein
MSHPDTNLMYIYIPKNATSWTKPNLLDWKWENYNYHKDNFYHKTAIIVLRDPVDRWVSGIAEYLYLYHRNLKPGSHLPIGILDLIFDKVSFDDHTERQIYFIEGIDPNKSVFFKCDFDYRRKFSHYLYTQNMPNNYSTYDFQHVSSEYPERQEWKKFIRHQLENSKYLFQIQQYFKLDYELINQVQFYDPGQSNT